MASLTKGHEFEQAPGVGDGQGSLVWAMDREAWCADSGIVAWAIAQ